MKKQTIEDYVPSQYAKSLVVAEAKMGKTVFLAAGALGVLPWQKYGGVVDDPSHLHVVALDANAAGGISSFLDMCGAPKEAKRANVINLQEDVRRIAQSESDHDYSFYNLMVQVKREIESQVKASKGVHLVLISSLTTLAQTLERAIAGPPGDPHKGGLGMDQNKWTEFARQLNELRNLFQQDSWHVIWEGHTYRPPDTSQQGGRAVEGAEKKETIQVSGKAGFQFPNNVEQVFRVRRSYGRTWEGSKVEEMYLDTRPTMDFVPGGRLFTEKLDPREPDMTLAFYKLGLTVGRWGAKKGKK
jgi:hypothetical protein